jgi:Beta-propeller repeat
LFFFDLRIHGVNACGGFQSFSKPIVPTGILWGHREREKDMSFLNPRTGLLFTAALVGGGASLTGCSVEEGAQEGALSQFHFSTGGWDLKGNVFGGGANDEATDILFAPNGRILVSGYENGNLGQSSVDPSGNARGVIYSYEIKSQQPGQPLERVSSTCSASSNCFTFGTNNSSAEVIESIALEPGALSTGFDVYFAGRSNGGYAGANQGQFDTFAGWATPSNTTDYRMTQFGTVRPQHPRRLTVTSARELVIGGYDDIYIPSNFVEAWENPFVLKAQRSGSGLVTSTGWPVIFDTLGSDVAPAMATSTTPGSPVYIAGTVTSGSGRGMFIKKYNSDGTLAWNQPVSPVGLDVAAALSVLSDGNVLFAGATLTTLGETNFGEQDLVVRKLTADNQVQWTKQIGTADPEIVTDMAVDTSGNIWLVGETLGSFDWMVPNQGGVDIFILKLSSDGELLASFQLGSEGDDHPSAIAVSGGKVAVSGYTTAKLFDNRNHVGNRDGFVFVVTPPSIGI